jgi:glycosyltransferase involved in cell wall biosynthesis
MKGSKSVKDRQNILEKCEAVFCVSEFIKNKFLEEISIKTDKVHVLFNGVDRKIKKFPVKKKEILFVGRLVSEKGADLYVQTLRSIASTFPDWNFGLIGSFRLGEHTNSNSYAHKVIKDFKEIGSQAIFYGFKNQEFVEEKMKTASIIVIPSIWEEPFGLVAAEAMSNGISIIASKVGGMPEIIGNNGVLIENINYKKLRDNLIELLKNRTLRESYQKKAWENFKLSSALSSQKLDGYRKIICQNYY